MKTLVTGSHPLEVPGSAGFKGRMDKHISLNAVLGGCVLYRVEPEAVSAMSSHHFHEAAFAAPKGWRP
jgi:hypothetical protein